MEPALSLWLPLLADLASETQDSQTLLSLHFLNESLKNPSGSRILIKCFAVCTTYCGAVRWLDGIKIDPLA